MTCLQREPHKRYASASEVRNKIVACIDKEDRINRDRLMAKYFSAKE